MSSQENSECTWAEMISMGTGDDFHGTFSQKDPKNYLKSWSLINTHSMNQYRTKNAT